VGKRRQGWHSCKWSAKKKANEILLSSRDREAGSSYGHTSAIEER